MNDVKGLELSVEQAGVDLLAAGIEVGGAEIRGAVPGDSLQIGDGDGWFRDGFSEALDSGESYAKAGEGPGARGRGKTGDVGRAQVVQFEKRIQVRE